LEKKQSKNIVDELMQVMDLEQLQNRKPDTLSGGQKQRVALARALVRKPKLLLLDEPLSALDTEMRLKLQDHILKLHKEFNLTTILVSHDFPEIYKMSDIILMLENGKIRRSGVSSDVLWNQQNNEDLKLVGEIIKIEKQSKLIIVSVSIGNNVIRTNVEEFETANLTIGDKVLVSFKAFNPMIRRIS